MRYPFPSEAWLNAFVEALNQDARYAEVARTWEGGLVFVIEADGEKGEPLAHYYLDLWHGRCRDAGVEALSMEDGAQPRWFTLRAPLRNFLQILAGDLDPMQAILTRRLRVEGDMAYMLRHIPTVLQFVRCAQTVEIDRAGEGI